MANPLQPKIIKTLKAAGWEVLNLNSVSTRGWPDLFAFRKGRVAWVEVKHGRDTLSEVQKIRIETLRQHGFEVIVARNLDDISHLKS
jgi:Holliday junction resolvase